MASANVVTLDGSNFDHEVLRADVPVLVDFWAEWCGPCKMIAPLLDEIAGEANGRFKVGKVDIDSNAELAGKFGIRAVPTLLIFKGGQVRDQALGVQSKRDILAKLAAA